MRLAGLTALVTGATRGLGLAMAQAFVAEGARVVMTGRTGDAGMEAAGALGAQARFLRCDLADSRSIEPMVAEADRLLGGIDILVNNAGDLHRASILDLPVEEYERIMRVNLTAPMLLTQHVGRVMVRERRGGSIINISSTGAAVCRPGGTTYHVSKAGLAMLTRVAALDLGQYRIRVNCIGPGAFKTELMLSSVSTTAGLQDDLLDATPLRRFGELHECAAVAVFLASRESSYITGQSIYVDGGRLVLNPSLKAPPKPDWVTDDLQR